MRGSGETEPPPPRQSPRHLPRPPEVEDGSERRRGAILMEVVLALAVFVMAGVAILGLVRTSMGGMDRMRMVRTAADLARSAMAKMEAGIETPQTLNGPVRGWLVGEEEAEDVGARAAGWELHVETEPTQFRGLTRVTVTAERRKVEGAESPDASYTLRQFVRLGGKGEDRAGGAGSLAEEAERGLPAGSGGSGGGGR